METSQQKTPDAALPSIAILAPTAPPATAGGVASAHLNIFESLRQLGCPVTLLSFNENGSQPGSPGIVRFGATQGQRSLMALASALYLKLRGSRKVAYQFVDILCSIPGVLKVNHFVKGLCPDVLIVPDHTAPGLMLNKGGASVVLIVHHIPSRFSESTLLGDFCPIDEAEATRLEQRVLQKVDAVICPSAYMKQVFQRTYRFDGEVTVLPNLVDATWIDAIPVRDVCSELGLDHDVPIVYIPSAGSLFKGSRYVGEIIRCLAEEVSGPLAFYLSGAVSDDLKESLAGLPENAVLFMPGNVRHDENVGYVKSCSFGVSPTLIESFGMAILEAGFCGVPMVVFDVGGTREVICEGENGLLAPLADVEALLDKAIRLLDPGVLSVLRQKTRPSVDKRFDSRQTAKDLLAVCHRVVKNPSGS